MSVNDFPRTQRSFGALPRCTRFIYYVIFNIETER